MPEVYLSPSPRHFNRGYGTYGTEEERMNLIADVAELELVRNGLTVERNNPSYDLQRWWQRPMHKIPTSTWPSARYSAMRECGAPRFFITAPAPTASGWPRIFTRSSPP